KSVSPPSTKLAAEPLLVKMEVPAEALLVKTILPKLPEPSTAVTKFCAVPELFVIPMPLIVRVNPGPAVIVYGFVAAGVKMMLFTSVFAEIETSVVCERPKVPVSPGPLGTPFGVQLAAVFQSPEMGSRSHWVLIAYVTVGTRNIREQRITA